jgi:D-alanyl-D-alanine carboxypeptidase
MKLIHAFCLALSLAGSSAPFVPVLGAKTDEVTASLEAIRAEIEFPALGAALVTADEVEGVWVTGTRRAGGKELVEETDRWHLGSCTKPMTATLIALLVARGDLAWDTPLEALLPDMADDMHADFRDVTLVELVSHRSGIVDDEGLVSRMPEGVDGSRAEHRADITRVLLSEPPAYPPRSAFKYSNAGYVVVGYIAQAKAGKTWEELMQELVFEPLGMKSAGFGAPGEPDVCDEPRGHRASGEIVEPEPEPDRQLAVRPCGGVHASLADWAKFVQLHLRGAHGDVEVGKIKLTREAFASLHQPFDAGSRRYARGWLVMNEPWAGGDGTTLNHSGTNTMWYCETWLGLERGVAVLMATNRYAPSGKNAPRQVLDLLIEQHEER